MNVIRKELASSVARRELVEVIKNDGRRFGRRFGRFFSGLEIGEQYMIVTTVSGGIIGTHAGYNFKWEDEKKSPNFTKRCLRGIFAGGACAMLGSLYVPYKIVEYTYSIDE